MYGSQLGHWWTHRIGQFPVCFCLHFWELIKSDTFQVPGYKNILTLAQWTFLTLLTFWVVWKIVDVCWFPWLPWASTTRNLHVGHVPLSGWCMVTCTVLWTNRETPGKTKRAISQGNIPNWLFQQLPTRAAVPHIYLYIYHNISRHIPYISAKLVVVNTDTYLNSIIPFSPFSPFGICPIFHVGCWPKPMVRKIPWSHYTILHPPFSEAETRRKRVSKPCRPWRGWRLEAANVFFCSITGFKPSNLVV